MFLVAHFSLWFYLMFDVFSDSVRPYISSMCQSNHYVRNQIKLNIQMSLLERTNFSANLLFEKILVRQFLKWHHHQRQLQVDKHYSSEQELQYIDYQLNIHCPAISFLKLSIYSYYWIPIPTVHMYRKIVNRKWCIETSLSQL